MSNVKLNSKEKIKLGSFYTPDRLVKKTYELLKKHIDKNKKYSYLDLAAGYGDFLKNTSNDYGIDIDKGAVDECKIRKGKANHFLKNSLMIETVSEIDKSIKDFIIVGNPPYNNLSSFYKKGEKGEFTINEKYKSRDLGISFMKLYSELEPDFVAVLHPLSFLIKESNFKQLKDFKDNYKLIDSYVFSSNEFLELNKKTEFPITIAIYKRDFEGMNFDYIQNFEFVFEGFKNNIKYVDFKTIDGFIHKYPVKNPVKTNNMFFTLRDNNALIKNATWLEKENNGTIFVDDEIWKYQYLVIYKKWLLNNLDKLLPIRNLSPLLFEDLRVDVKLQNRLNTLKTSVRLENKIFKYLDDEIGSKLVKS